MTRWDLVYKWSDPESQSLVDAVTSALENCDRKLTEAEARSTPAEVLCYHGMFAYGDDGCIHCDCKTPGFRASAGTDPEHCVGCDSEHCDGIEAEALAQGGPSLDVERLALALDHVEVAGSGGRNPHLFWQKASRLAAEYARLGVAP